MAISGTFAIRPFLHPIRSGPLPQCQRGPHIHRSRQNHRHSTAKLEVCMQKCLVCPTWTRVVQLPQAAYLH